MNNIVIYTSITGKYDKLNEPVEVMEALDYICFSNDVSVPENSVWKIRPIPLESKDKTRQARFIKTNPHEILKDYQYSLWIDGNVIIKDKYVFKRIHELIENNILISMPKHPLRDCTYDEANILNKIGKEKILISRRWKFRGFAETTVLFIKSRFKSVQSRFRKF